jgi:chromosomal replication initiation ATPase DnaA
LVARHWQVPPESLRRRYMRGAVVRQKRQAIYLAVISGHSVRQIGRISGHSHETVARSCRDVEDARDDAELDRVLDELELQMTGS